MATGSAYVPVEINVFATGEATLPIEISTGVTGSAACNISINVLSSAFLSGSSTVADSLTGAALWSPVVEFGGANITADVIGEITIEASEGAARIASFTMTVSGVIDLPSLVGQPVIIDIADPAGSNRLRLFTGLVDSPAIDLEAATITISATDDLMNAVNAMSRMTLTTMIDGVWSPNVFDPAAVPWSFAQDQLSTMPVSLDMDPYGMVRVTPWEAKSTPDMSFDDGVILQGSVSVSTADRSGLINDMMIDFGYRVPVAKREAYEVDFKYMGALTFGQWLQAGNPFLLRSSVEDAVADAGFAIDSINWLTLPQTIQLIPPGIMWLPNPLADAQFCLGFEAVLTFDYTQQVEEAHGIRVYSQASIDAVGRLPASMSGAIDGKTVDTVAAETNAVLYKADITKIPGLLTAATIAGNTTSAVLPLTADTDRAAADLAMNCLIDVAKTRIASSHRDGRVSASLALHPLVDLDKTIEITAAGVVASGKVVSLTHRMIASKASAQTDFQIALTRLDGLGLAQPEDPTQAPAGVADGVTGTLGAPTITYNALYGQDQEFTITFPAVTSGERDAKTVILDSEYNVPIIEDVLTINL